MDRLRIKSVFMAIIILYLSGLNNLPLLNTLNNGLYPSNSLFTENTYQGTLKFNLTLNLRTLSNQHLVEVGNIAKVKFHYNETYSLEYWTSTGLLRIENLTSGNTYRFEVYWKKVLVNETTFQFTDITGEINMTVICNVSRVKIRSLNNQGDVAVGGIRFLLKHQKSQVAFEIYTDVNGEASSLLPTGTYIVDKAYYRLTYQDGLGWDDIDVSPQPPYLFNLTEDSEEDINLRIYNVSFLVTSRDGVPITGASAVFIIKRGFKTIDEVMLDAYGRTPDMLLPWGVYVIECYWKEILILNDTLNIVSDVFHEYRKTSFYSNVTILLVDDRGRVLKGVNVTIETPWGERLRFMSNEKGVITMKNVPFGYYNFIWVCRGKVIRQTEYIDERYETVVLASYTLEVALECKGYAEVPPGLVVSLYISDALIESKISNGSYVYFSRLPKELYRILVYWQGVNVVSKMIFLNKSTSITLECEIFMLSLKVVDKMMRPLGKALIDIYMPNGTKRRFYADNSGSLKLDYLPYGVYEIRVYWKNIMVNKSLVSLNRNLLEYSVKANVGDLQLKVVGFFGQPLKGAHVRVYMDYMNGSRMILCNLTSDDDGLIILRQVPLLPNIKYIANIDYYKKFYIKDVELSEEGKHVKLDVALLILNYPLSPIEIVLICSGITATLITSYIIIHKKLEREALESLIYEPEKLERMRERGRRVEFLRRRLEWDYVEKPRRGIIARLKALFLGGEEVLYEKYYEDYLE